ncbi:MAG: hypothetical protein ACRYGG_02315 [Janthinobacterium lividum]
MNNETQHGQSTYTYGSEGISKEDWVRTVVKGADDRSPRWKHLLVLGGLLIGFEGSNRRGLPSALRRVLETAVVIAANLALEDEQEGSAMARHTVCLVVGHVFDLLSQFERARLNHDRLLPVLTQAMYLSNDGLQWGYFLGIMDADVVQVPGNKFNWPAKSATFLQIQKIASGPLVALLGTLSRLTAFCAENVQNPNLLFKMAEQLSGFTRTLCVQWRQNKLSEVDSMEEELFLHEEAIKTTLPLLWQLLKSAMFLTVISQSVLLGRVLGDGRLPTTQGSLPPY